MNNHAQVYAMLKTAGVLPEYVTSHAPETTDKVLHNRAFLNPATRQGPCHTKAACYMSIAVQLANGGSDDPAMAAGITKQANAWGIGEDLLSLLDLFEDKFTSVAKEASEATPDMSEFAHTIVEEDENGTKTYHGCFPCKSSFDIKQSAVELQRAYMSGDVSLDVYRKVSCVLVKEAAAQQVEENKIPDHIVEVGRNRLPNPLEAQTKLASRGLMGADLAPYNEVLGNLDAFLSSSSSFQTMEQAIDAGVKAAAEIAHLDKQNGIDDYTRPSLKSPLNLVFCGMTMSEFDKAAATSFMHEGVIIPNYELLNLSENTILGNFSKESAEIILAARAELTTKKASTEVSDSVTYQLDQLSPEDKRELTTLMLDNVIPS